MPSGISSAARARLALLRSLMERQHTRARTLAFRPRPPRINRMALMRLEFDHAWRILRCSPTGAALLGSSPERLLGRVIWDVMPRGAIDAPLGVALQHVALSRTSSIVYVKSFLRPGAHIWAHITPTATGGVRIAQRLLVSAQDLARYAQALVVAMGSSLAIALG